jgi:hypothetical protein
VRSFDGEAIPRPKTVTTPIHISWDSPATSQNRSTAYPNRTLGCPAIANKQPVVCDSDRVVRIVSVGLVAKDELCLPYLALKSVQITRRNPDFVATCLSAPLDRMPAAVASLFFSHRPLGSKELRQ